MAEAALINTFQFIDKFKLTNIVVGHHAKEALTVEEFEKIYGAQELCENDIHH